MGYTGYDDDDDVDDDEFCIETISLDYDLTYRLKTNHKLRMINDFYNISNVVSFGIREVLSLTSNSYYGYRSNSCSLIYFICHIYVFNVKHSQIRSYLIHQNAYFHNMPFKHFYHKKLKCYGLKLCNRKRENKRVTTI